MKSLNFNCLKNCVLAMALVMGGLSVLTLSLFRNFSVDLPYKGL